MKSRDLITVDYDHGLQITNKGRTRLQDEDLSKIQIPRQARWDGRWRLVFFDIPEEHKTARDVLTRKLKRLNFYKLQKACGCIPFPAAR